MTSIPGADQLRFVSCPAVSLCVGVDPYGQVVTSTDPTGGASAWSVAEFGSGDQLNGVSCVSTSFCVAVGINGLVLTSTDPAGGASAWNPTLLAETNPAEPGRPGLRAVSCVEGPLCVAVDTAGEAHVSADPAAGAGSWRSTGSLAGLNSTIAVSCASASLCVTGDLGNIITSTDPGEGATSWEVFGAGAGFQFTGFSCPTDSHCAAVDNDGDVLGSNDPSAGETAWKLTKLISGASDNGFHGISCPTTGLCVAVGVSGTIASSSEPFVLEANPTPPAVRTLRRPRVLITHHPPRRVRTGAAVARVSFRFRGVGNAREFRCRLDRRPFTRCRSPRSYHPARGRHRFAVRAVGPTQLAGHTATFTFHVLGR